MNVVYGFLELNKNHLASCLIQFNFISPLYMKNETDKEEGERARVADSWKRLHDWLVHAAIEIV